MAWSRSGSTGTARWQLPAARNPCSCQCAASRTSCWLRQTLPTLGPEKSGSHPLPFARPSPKRPPASCPVLFRLPPTFSWEGPGVPPFCAFCDMIYVTQHLFWPLFMSNNDGSLLFHIFVVAVVVVLGLLGLHYSLQHAVRSS